MQEDRENQKQFTVITRTWDERKEKKRISQTETGDNIKLLEHHKRE